MSPQVRARPLRFPSRAVSLAALRYRPPCIVSGPAPLGSETTALLGPTNTGKTHQCLERMLEHATGMLGLPLRLLAREVYDKLSARIGERHVALITGEEKRVPSHPSYWICTVEAMPMDLEVDFLAVDEIQLVAHQSRGHVFTHRLLHGRGRHETWFMGSDTVRPLVQHLVPAAKVSRRPRLSKLSHAGPSSLGKLPPRSAIVAFNATQVYELAERVKARRGGAAVVLGALSPRTRNAQVAMFQAGEVDTLIATDAIGMGLNLPVRHVAFAGLRKFDGKRTRSSSAAELAQIAGRAGRHLDDGSFGSLDPCPPLPESVVRAIETHSFAPDKCAVWRNAELDFSRLDGLLHSLAERPSRPGLQLITEADDTTALHALSRRPSVQRVAHDAAAVELLWQVCQIPDYRKLLPEAHAELLYSLFCQLILRENHLDEDWVAERIERLDDIGGDIDALMGRLSFVRTWTYISHQPGWLPHAAHWQARTRELEDRLSDTLHERLVQRFVERRKKAAPAPRARSRKEAARPTTIDPAGPFAALLELQDKLRAPAAQELPEIERIVSATHDELTLDARGRIELRGLEVGQLRRGRSLLLPEVCASEQLAPGSRSRVERRLRAYAKDLVGALLEPLLDRPSDSAAVRGLLYQLRLGLGTWSRKSARSQLDQLSEQERQQLHRRGVQLGREWVFCLPLLSADALETRRALCCVFHGLDAGRLPASQSKVAPRLGHPAAIWAPLGYVTCGAHVVRCDTYEGALRLMRRKVPDPRGVSQLLDGAGAALPELVAQFAKRRRRKRRSRRRAAPS